MQEPRETEGSPAQRDGAAPPAATGSAGRSAALLAFEDWAEDAAVGPGEIGDLLIALDKAARARRLYQDNNPVYQSFHKQLHDALTALWDRLPSLSIALEEEAFRCFGHSFPSKDGREGLPFLFYRDGIRLMTLLPGFEDEIERFLTVVDRARQFGPSAGDDIVTLLWEEEFSSFQYSYVDLLAEAAGATGPDAEPRPPVERVDAAQVERLATGEEKQPVPPSVAAGEPPVATAVLPDHFVETPYFLEPEEVELLQREVGIEWDRDLRKAVLDALFDRIEDHEFLDRRSEIIRIFGQLLPAFLGRGDLGNAATIVQEVNSLIRAGDLGGEEKEEALRLLRDLNDPGVLSNFIGSLEDGSIDPSHEQLGIFLSFLGPEALPLLLRTAVQTGAALAQRLWPALDTIGRKHPRAVVSLLMSPEEPVATGAARLVGNMRLPEARDALITLFGRTRVVETRRITIDALAGLGDAQSLETVQQALTDADREIRIAAARALGAARTRTAYEPLRTIIGGRSIRDADLTEKIAFYEAFGTVAGEADVELLAGQLNGRRLLGGREAPELRACAATALGRIAAPAARAALLKAAKDENPVVRNAVTRALTPERRGR